MKKGRFIQKYSTQFASIAMLVLLCLLNTALTQAQNLPQSRLKGEVYFEQGNYLKALQEFDKYEKHQRAILDEMYLHRKAEVLYKLGLFDEALECYARVLDTDKDFTDYKFFWGLMMRSSDPTEYYKLEEFKQFSSLANTDWMSCPKRFNIRPFHAINSRFSEFGAVDYKGRTFYSTNAGWVGSSNSAALDEESVQSVARKQIAPPTDTSTVQKDEGITFYYPQESETEKKQKRTKVKKRNRSTRKLSSKDINTKLTYFDIYSVNSKDANAIADFDGRDYKNLRGNEKNALKESVKNLALTRYKEINTRYNDGPISFYDGNKVMVTSNKKHRKRLESYFNLNLYESEINPKGEFKRKKESFFGSHFNKNSVGHITFSPDGQQACMVVKLKNSKTGSDLYFSKRKANGKWEDPVKGGQSINTERDEQFPFWAPNGKLYYSSDGFAGKGGLDIYQIDPFRVGAVPQNMGVGINSPYDDFAFWMDTLGAGYLTSNRRGGQGKDDIYKFELKRGAVKVILLCDTVFATEPWFELKDRQGNAIGKFNIRKFPEKVYPQLPYNDYVLNHLFPADSVYENIELYQDTVIVYVDFPSADTLQVRFTNFCFDCDDRSEINQEKFDKLVAFLAKFPELKVVIKGNTDQFGTNAYNDALGMRRANSMEKWLLDAHVSNELVKISNGKRHTVSRTDHRLNRRVDIELYMPDSTELLTFISKNDPRLERDLVINYDEPIHFDTQLKEGYYLQIYRSNHYMNKAQCAEKYGLGNKTGILLYSNIWNEFNYYISVSFESERAARNFAVENGLKANIVYLK